MVNSKINQHSKLLDMPIIVGTFCVPFMFLLIILNINYAYQICACLTALSIIILRVPSEWRFSQIDITIVAITILWLLSPFWSICRTPSVKTATLSVVLLGFYFLIKLLSQNDSSKSKMINYLAVIFILTEILAIVTFALHCQKAKSLGFDNLYPVRYLFHPFAETNNCWAEISLLGFAVCLLASRFRFLTSLLCSVGVLVTFSRGAYLSLAVIVVLLLNLCIKRKEYKSALIGILLGFLTILIIFPQEVSTVASITGTESQKKSLIWRKASSETAITVFKEAPILGVGSCSYSMVCNERSSNGTSFTDYPPNIFVEVLVEKGILGLFIYGWLLFLILYRVIKFRNDIYSMVICLLILIILLKEISQATIHSSLSGSFAVTLLLALIPSCKTCKNYNINTASHYSIYSFLLGAVVFATAVIPSNIFRSSVEKELIVMMSELKKKNYEPKLCTSSFSKYDTYAQLIIINLFLRQGRFSEATEMINCINNDSGYNEFYKGLLYIHNSDTIGAISHLSKALIKTPSIVRCVEFQQLNKKIRDTSVNIAIDVSDTLIDNPEAVKGSLLYYMGECDMAKQYLRMAIKKNPALQMPYKLLGENEKYDFLVYGAFAIPNHRGDDSKYLSVMDLLLREYSIRFRTWYSVRNNIY